MHLYSLQFGPQFEPRFELQFEQLESQIYHVPIILSPFRPGTGLGQYNIP
jgi:5-hydroxyisourate hydrolase-like protein (transthyretin family)